MNGIKWRRKSFKESRDKTLFDMHDDEKRASES